MAKRTIRKTVLEIVPVRSYDIEGQYYQLDDGSCMDLMQIRSKDLVNSSEDEVEYDCLKFARAYRLYADDIKILCLNFPCDNSRQKRFLEHKIKNTRNEIFREQLEKKKRELEWLEKNDTTREYYFMLFAKNLEELEKNRRTLSASLGAGQEGLVGKISPEKKHQVLSRLYNKCSLANS